MHDIVSPRQTVLITCRGKAKVLGVPQLKDNIMTLDWHMPVSFDPFLYSIAVGKDRFSQRLIKDSGVFVVNFLSHKHMEHARYCGKHSGELVDKFRKLDKDEAEVLDCPRLRDAVAFLECQVTDVYDAGDHTVFVGRVVNSKLISENKRLFHLPNHDFDIL